MGRGWTTNHKGASNVKFQRNEYIITSINFTWQKKNIPVCILFVGALMYLFADPRKFTPRCTLLHLNYYIEFIWLFWSISMKKFTSVLSVARKKNEWAKRMNFLQANLRTRVNYFSVIDQNNQINCILHFHSCFTFEFSHSAVMISYQNSSSQCMNFRRRGLVWKSVALFSL